jgi:hypothetical protein
MGGADSDLEMAAERAELELPLATRAATEPTGQPA